MVVLTEITEQSSSSSSSSSNNKYDVFLSFRGEDTRSNFTDHLLKALLEATIDTFFDDAEIQIGDFLKPELESAIKSSRASIIVLSPNYASSTWCLDELALIMEQPKHIVYPIFYHVNPSDVRKQRNSFREAMAEHKQRMETETDAEKRSQWAHKIEKWKKALTKVADIKGEEANGRRETILIEGIVKEISSRLNLHKRSEIPELIGMKDSVRTITSFLNNASTEFLTIWGMAGIGKTHLADYIFKSNYLDFESSCFLEDIERRSARPTKESLQLLSWHALGRNVPNEGDKKKAMKIVQYCKGHPLALKVLGSSFRGEDATWDDIVESLGKEINPDITKVLKISLDTLPSKNKLEKIL